MICYLRLPLGGFGLFIASCASFQQFSQPLGGNGDFDPLSAPGSGRSNSTLVQTNVSYTPGQWLETSMPNATFFRAIPKGNTVADKVLGAGTPLKVVSNSGTYVKVELDSGDIGFIPEIMVSERSGTNEIPVTGPLAPLPDFGEVPPPIDPADLSAEGIEPLPIVPDLPPPVPSISDLSDLPATGADNPPPLPLPDAVESSRKPAPPAPPTLKIPEPIQ